jgi:hypothetical protein
VSAFGDYRRRLANAEDAHNPRRCSLINLREHLRASLSAFGDSSDTVTPKMLKIVEGAHSPA